MIENLLHFIWKFKKFNATNLLSTSGEVLQIVHPGAHNQGSGPDFFNAKIVVAGQLWVGNVEIHLKSSDWYAHHHEADERYKNVILHVVWEDDAVVFGTDNIPIPTLLLRTYVSPQLLKAHKELFNKHNITFINCEKNIKDYNTFGMAHWLERLFFERLEQKSVMVQSQLNRCNNNWEHVMFTLLLKSFGSKINGPAFLALAEGLDFSAVQKVKHNAFELEALLMGSCGLLKGNEVDNYYLNLRKAYTFIHHKFQLKTTPMLPPEFFKLRPVNFPTIRLSQFAQLYSRHQNLFRQLIAAKTMKELYTLFEVKASPYWDTHFTFGKPTKSSKKQLSKKFIDLLIINTVLPLKFCYAKQRGMHISETLVSIIQTIKKEENKISNTFKLYGVRVNNAMESQALIQLHTGYCLRNRCLECAVGGSLLQRA